MAGGRDGMIDDVRRTSYVVNNRDGPRQIQSGDGGGFARNVE